MCSLLPTALVRRLRPPLDTLPVLPIKTRETGTSAFSSLIRFSRRIADIRSGSRGAVRVSPLTPALDLAPRVLKGLHDGLGLSPCKQRVQAPPVGPPCSAVAAAITVRIGHLMS
jgi:hypothetical protein